MPKVIYEEFRSAALARMSTEWTKENDGGRGSQFISDAALADWLQQLSPEEFDRVLFASYVIGQQFVVDVRRFHAVPEDTPLVD